MKPPRPIFQYLAFVFIILLVIISGANTASAQDSFQATEPPPPMAPAVDASGWVIIDLPPGSTQLEIGKEAYRLVCAACHAYDGSGLTEAWRSTWNIKDQNCWQSKCHGYNHPPDGFYLPDSPPVVGSFVPSLFPTAQDMYDYIKRTMPWQNPGHLPDDIAWAVTAHVIRLNGYDSIPELNDENAASFRLQPETKVTTELPAPTSIAVQPTEIFLPAIASENNKKDQPKNNFILWIAGGAFVVAVAVLAYRKIRNS